MIVYRKHFLFGFGLITKIHGSAVYRASLPAIFSTSLLFLYIYGNGTSITDNEDHRMIEQPQTIQVYIVFFSLLLTFRLSYAYQRYWEGCSSVYHMMSKWMDCALDMAAFHYQCSQFDKYRPPAFGAHRLLRNITREREREGGMTMEETAEVIGEVMEEKQKELKKRSWFRRFGKKPSKQQSDTNLSERSQGTVKAFKPGEKTSKGTYQYTRIPIPRTFQKQFLLKSQRTVVNNDFQLGVSAPVAIPPPSLFLQETAHLFSLLSAVALSTLRNDVPGAEAPLIEYFPGQPMPPVNPDELSKDLRQNFQSSSAFITVAYFLLGLSRNDRSRTLYNAGRPFPVLGGVSDGEIQKLQEAQGPVAKVALVSFWAQEFLIREQLNGSTGAIPSPIISRLQQFISDGQIGYNQARKVVCVPFPFPHAQMTVFFTLIVIGIFPVLNYSFVNNLEFACVLNFITVLCFLGIYETARELENPMENVPNELPLVNLQAQFNEALVTMYAGFHPDSWWVGEKDKQDDEKPSP